MCGRFAVDIDEDTLTEVFELVHVPPLRSSWNVAPTQSAPVILDSVKRGGWTVEPFRWGLIPRWARDESGGARLINARSETVHTKPAFRAAFAARRCLVPVSGFYEWAATGSGKQPWYFAHPNGAPLALAGLWERWRDAAGEPVHTFCIITCAPNDVVRPVHARMPAILPAEAWPRWLDAQTEPEIDELRALLAPCPVDVLTGHRVSRAVNSPRNDGAELIAPID